MITELELAWVEFYARLAVRVKVFGVEWNSQTKRMVATTSKWKRWLCNLYFLVHAILIGYYGLRFFTGFKAVQNKLPSANVLHVAIQLLLLLTQFTMTLLN